MTNKTQAWAMGQAPVTDPIQKLILLVLAEYARDDGSNVWLSQSNIAKKACCSVRTVRNHLAAMEQAGLICKGDPSGIPDRVPLHRRPTVWDLQLDQVQGPAVVIPDPDTESQDSVDNFEKSVDNPVDNHKERDRQILPPPASDARVTGRWRQNHRQNLPPSSNTSKELSSSRARAPASTAPSFPQSGNQPPAYAAGRRGVGVRARGCPYSLRGVPTPTGVVLSSPSV